MIRFLLLWCFVVIISSTAEELSFGADVATFIQEKIDDFDVMVFAKSYCPHCASTKRLIKEMQELLTMKVEFLDLDLMNDSNDGRLIQNELKRFTGQHTVPNIFIGGVHMGGNSDIQQMHAIGELEEVLWDAIGGHEL